MPVARHDSDALFPAEHIVGDGGRERGAGRRVARGAALAVRRLRGLRDALDDGDEERGGGRGLPGRRRVVGRVLRPAHQRLGVRRHAAGFTLVEMLVALTLLAILGGLAWRGLDQLLHARARVADVGCGHGASTILIPSSSSLARAMPAAAPLPASMATGTAPVMPTSGAESPIQRVPSGFPGPGGTGSLPAAQAVAPWPTVAWTAGWLIGIPVPLLLIWAPTWGWVIFANVLLGVNQGLTWSMTQTAKLDLAGARERGTAIGLNEFAGYVGVAVAAIVTGYAASYWNARTGLMVFGSVVTLLAITLAWLAVIETQPWADAEAGATPADPGSALSTADIFALMSWRDRRLAALSQAGLVEKFVDALVWVFWPVYLHQRGVSLSGIGWIVGVYGFTWGGAQFFTGKLSDRVGRHRLNVWGMWLCGAGVALLPLGFLAWRLIDPGSSWQDALAMGFDLAAAVFLLSLLPLLRDFSVAEMRRHADQNDANRTLVLLLSTVLAAVVMAAISGELQAARAGAHAAMAKLLITLALAWLFANAVYGLHYAHSFYIGDGNKGRHRGGIEIGRAHV